MKELLGDSVLSIFISDDKKILAFDMLGGIDYIYVVNDYCCTESFFKSITNPQNLTVYKHDILSIEIKERKSLQVPKTKDCEDHPWSKQYIETTIFSLKTEVGSCEIEYVSIDNGYHLSDGYEPSKEAIIVDNKHGTWIKWPCFAIPIKIISSIYDRDDIPDLR